MKTQLLVMVGLLVSATIFAQRGAEDTRDVDSRDFERMKDDLALSDAQYASARDIESRYSKKRDEQRAVFEKRMAEDRKTMRALRLERERELRKILTPEQNQKLDELRASRDNDHRFREEEHDHDDRPRSHRHHRPHHHDRAEDGE